MEATTLHRGDDDDAEQHEQAKDIASGFGCTNRASAIRCPLSDYQGFSP
jgi:hypothetical protein